MALQSGRYATVRATYGTIPFMGHWEVNITMDSADATYFGSVWKRQMVMMQSWSASISGYFDNSTNSTQNLLLLTSGVMKAAPFVDLRFFIDTSSGMFLMPYNAQSTDDCAYLTSWKATADKAGITTVDATFVGSGALALFMTTTGTVISSSS